MSDATLCAVSSRESKEDGEFVECIKSRRRKRQELRLERERRVRVLRRRLPVASGILSPQAAFPSLTDEDEFLSFASPAPVPIAANEEKTLEAEKSSVRRKQREKYVLASKRAGSASASAVKTEVIVTTFASTERISTATEVKKASDAPKNDYCQHFVDTGERPQNFIRDADVETRFEEYPKLQELMSLKNERIRERATPPMFMKCDLKDFRLSSLGTKFDVILIDPPWLEYRRRCPGAVAQNLKREVWSPQDIMKLRVDAVANSPSFLFLWVGSEEGIEWGRKMIRKWGFRRCEDICWVKQNLKSKQHTDKDRFNQNTVIQHTSEHCLMGIKGTVKRSTDGHFIHANVDTDVLISEEPPYGTAHKPYEMYELIERFCLGRRRLELFGTDRNIRPGWVTLGKDLSSSNYDQEVYSSYFQGPGGHLLGATERIEQLRPKSPPRSGRGARGGRGRGRGRGGGGGRGRGRGH